MRRLSAIRTFLGLIAVAALLVVPAVASADFSDNFTTSADGTAISSVGYTGYGYAGILGGQLLLGHPATGSLGGSPYDLGTWDSSALVTRNSTNVGAGTYTWNLITSEWNGNYYQGTTASMATFGQADNNNFYYVLCTNDGVSSTNLVYLVGHMSNGVKTDLGTIGTVTYTAAMGTATNPTSAYPQPNVNETVTVNWDPAAGAISIGILVTSDTGTTVFNNTATPFTVSDGDFANSGTVGLAQNAHWNDSGTCDRATGIGFAAAVPEPATMTLLVLGGVGVLVRRRRK